MSRRGSDFSVGDVVWAKIGSFSQPWPGKIVRLYSPSKRVRMPKCHVCFFGSKKIMQIPKDRIFLYASNKRRFLLESSSRFNSMPPLLTDAVRCADAELCKAKAISSCHEIGFKDLDIDADYTILPAAPLWKNDAQPGPTGFVEALVPCDCFSSSPLYRRKLFTAKLLARLKKKQTTKISGRWSFSTDYMYSFYLRRMLHVEQDDPRVLLCSLPESITTSSKIKVTCYADVKSGLKLGFIGVDEIGRQILHELLTMGYEITLWCNHVCEKDRQLNVRYAYSAQEVFRISDITFCCQQDAYYVREILFDVSGIYYALKGNKGLVMCTTISQQDSLDVCDIIQVKGCRYLECSLFKNHENHITALTAGNITLYHECHSFFAHILYKVYYLGDIGKAAKLNTVLKAFGGALLGILVDLMVLGRLSGIALEDITEVLHRSSLNANFLVEKAKEITRCDNNNWGSPTEKGSPTYCSLIDVRNQLQIVCNTEAMHKDERGNVIKNGPCPSASMPVHSHALARFVSACEVDSNHCDVSYAFKSILEQSIAENMEQEEYVSSDE